MNFVITLSLNRLLFGMNLVYKTSKNVTVGQVETVGHFRFQLERYQATVVKLLSCDISVSFTRKLLMWGRVYNLVYNRQTETSRNVGFVTWAQNDTRWDTRARRVSLFHCLIQWHPTELCGWIIVLPRGNHWKSIHRPNRKITFCTLVDRKLIETWLEQKAVNSFTH